MGVTRVHFTADWHLGHEAVIKFSERPFHEIASMDAWLILQFNAWVKPNDIVYCLGDMSFHPPSIGVPLLRQLNGTKFLIKGNHDKYSHTQYRSAGFQVLDEAVIDLRGKKLRLSHYPYAPTEEEIKAENLQPYDLRYLDTRPVKRDHEFLIHGHVHTQWKVKGRQVNVGCDVWNYHPVSESQLESVFAAIDKTP